MPSSVIEALPKTGSVLIAKNGKARAVLLPVDDGTDLESLLLSQNKRALIDKSIGSAGSRRRTRRRACRTDGRAVWSAWAIVARHADQAGPSPAPSPSILS